MMWMVRTPGGQYAAEILHMRVVAIGWESEGGLLMSAKSPQDFYAAIRKSYPEYPEQKIINTGSQLHKFFRVMKKGDTVLTYDTSARVYHVGKVAGEVRIDQKAPADLNNVRDVEWQHAFSRDQLSLAARNSLGSTLSIFQPSEEAEKEILKAISSPSSSEPATPTAEVETEDPLTSAVENSRELIKDKLTNLSWEEMQALVAGILRAMGYKTKISAGGSDRGKDIIASPDGLALQQPRIFVEVKHRKGQMGAPEVRKFIGGRNAQNDKCLYVSTGGFTTEARYEAERSNVPLTLIDSDELVELLVEHYELTDSETRTLVPLRKTYWPA
jgi:restriction system protein